MPLDFKKFCFPSPSGDHAFSNIKHDQIEKMIAAYGFRPLQGIMHLATRALKNISSTNIQGSFRPLQGIMHLATGKGLSILFGISFRPLQGIMHLATYG